MNPVRILMLISALGAAPASYAAEKDDRLSCENVIDFKEFKGRTYLDFMATTVKPELDRLATKGYPVAGSEKVAQVLANVSDKVRRKALAGAKGEEKLLELADTLAGSQASLYDLPEKIASAGREYDRYNLSTFLGLASCGGVTIKYHPKNFAYNIHYGTGAQKTDNRTGRSFGAGPTRAADDASDKAYLTDLQEYVTSADAKELPSFYRTLIEALTNSDSSGYKGISPFGQTLLTDFLAVYTAEQDRNLMDGRISLHWDAALLEVTLLSAFHAGQDQITLMFKNPNTEVMSFTNKVVNQGPGGSVRTKEREAALIDYWQFSSNPDPQHRNRSGINITKEEFRTLGRIISDYERKHNKALVEKVERHFQNVELGGNIFEELSLFLINPKAQKSLGKTAYELALDYTELLMQVRKDAKAITASIQAEGFEKPAPRRGFRAQNGR